jgi:anaerobic magnesium-protoporphyrin IX monomethyl ester cyclase
MRWYSRIGRRVWLHEIRCFLFRDRRSSDGPALGQFWTMRSEIAEEAMAIRPGQVVRDAP